jgi:hypothetical protein
MAAADIAQQLRADAEWKERRDAARARMRDLATELEQGERIRNVERCDEKWFSSQCGESFHSFGRDEKGHWQAWHVDNEKCEAAEFGGMA